MIQFEQGKKYWCNSVCDSNCTWLFEIIKRTDNNVWIKDHHTGETVRKKVKVWNDVEEVMPLGTYSMAPILSAERIAA